MGATCASSSALTWSYWGMALLCHLVVAGLKLTVLPPFPRASLTVCATTSSNTVPFLQGKVSLCSPGLLKLLGYLSASAFRPGR